MIEYRTVIVGAHTRTTYEEYSPVGGFSAPSLEKRFDQAAAYVAFWSAALEAAGIAEPLIVQETPVAHTPQEVEQIRVLS